MNQPLDVQDVVKALEGLLAGKNAEGDRLLYNDHREFIRGDERSPLQVVMTQCRVCGGIDDDHVDECVVGIAEHALRRVMSAKV